MLPDEPIELRPGVSVRSYSVDDLRRQSIFRHLPAHKLAARLASTGAGSSTWPFSDFFCTVGLLFAEQLGIPLSRPALRDAVRRRKPSPLDAKTDRELIETMIKEGYLFAIGSVWGVSPEYWLLYAAAAAFLEHLGYEHPNDIP